MNVRAAGLALAGALAGFLAMTGPARAEVVTEVLDFDRLEGWAEDDHAAALSVFRNTCDLMRDPDWGALCAAAGDAGDARAFFELFFRPVVVRDARPALFTGYYEPELDGALRPDTRHRFPVYAMPPEAKLGQWLSRRDILTSGVMEGRGLEIAWVDDPVELFFLQIQGSGRIRLPDGSHIRVGYAGKNGHTYRSVGAEMVRRGIYQAHQVSAQVIKNWVRRNGAFGEELLFHNPSFVFFRRVTEVSPEDGPIGAMNRSVSTMRSIAVDPDWVPLGAPVWVEKDGKQPLRRLMIAQDTGSAIKGPQRADIFFGSGDAAGRAAGRLKDPGRMVVLMPIQRAYALLPGDVE